MGSRIAAHITNAGLPVLMLDIVPPGTDANAPRQERNKIVLAALDSLKLVFALGPALAHLLSAALIYGFPLDERRHFQIRAALSSSSNSSIPK